ncbi:MAG: glutaredoxin family protein [Cyanobacterium sp. T60_A2020_053]|nr:glutaredoxin family protein [Cyanobacterium sp. T60_A2020_053]
MHIILYSKQGCHLCEGLEEKLNLIDDVTLDIRDITSNEEWFNLYQYEIPVMYLVTAKGAVLIPRTSPRISVNQLYKTLQNFVSVTN